MPLTLPYTIANGQAIDAGPVMADFNALLAAANSAQAALAGMQPGTPMPAVSDCNAAPLGFSSYGSSTPNAPSSSSGILCTLSSAGDLASTSNNLVVQTAHTLYGHSWYRAQFNVGAWSTWSQSVTMADMTNGSLSPTFGVTTVAAGTSGNQAVNHTQLIDGSLSPTFGVTMIAAGTSGNQAVNYTQLMQGIARNGINVISASATLTSANAGQLIYVTGSSPVTVTLPLANASGAATMPIVIVNGSSSTVTVAVQSGESLGLPYPTLYSNQVAAVTNDGTSVWTQLWSNNGSISAVANTVAQRDANGRLYAIGGTSGNGLVSAAQFALGLGTNGYQKLPSGLIIQWGNYSIPTPAAGYTGFTITFPIAFPNNLLSICIGSQWVNNGSTWQVNFVNYNLPVGPNISQIAAVTARGAAATGNVLVPWIATGN